MNTELSDLLVSRKIGKKGNPLFHRPVDIVKAVLSNSNSPLYIGDSDSPEYTKKFNNLKVYISQVLKGFRPASKLLIDAIKVCALENLSNKENADFFLKELEDALKAKIKRGLMNKDDEELDELHRWIKIAKTHFIFTSAPEELYEDEYSNEITLPLLTNLGLISTVEVSSVQKKFEYYFPKPFIAVEFYKKLFIVAKQYNHGSSDEDISKSFANISSNLKVYTIPSFYCWLPHSVFNLNTESETGFIYIRQDKGEPSVAKMSKDTLKNWKDDFYSDIYLKREEVKFNQIKQYLNE